MERRSFFAALLAAPLAFKKWATGVEAPVAPEDIKVTKYYAGTFVDEAILRDDIYNAFGLDDRAKNVVRGAYTKLLQPGLRRDFERAYAYQERKQKSRRKKYRNRRGRR